ncbi:hypothetical protein P4050_00555 [Pseudomonas aeruginosa]|nr:hypothetical protein [Pseudomonas aeruginosa]
MHARQEEAKRKAAAKAAYAAMRAAQGAARLWERLSEKAARAISTASRSSGSAVATATAGVSMVPMPTFKGLVGLQTIYPGRGSPDTGRHKAYWPYGSAEGRSVLPGSVRAPNSGEPVPIAEGYATGVSLHMAMGCAVAIAFDAGNLAAGRQGDADRVSVSAVELLRR